MKEVDHQTNNIISKFLQMYEMINCRLFADGIIEESSANSNQKLFEIISSLLLTKFLACKDLIPTEILPLELLYDAQSDSKIDEIYTSELLNKFDYSLQEGFNDENNESITPLIFSYLFEYSQLSQDKQNQGLFYTSSTLVDFMCKEVIASYLEKNTDLSTDNILTFIWDETPITLNEKQIISLRNKLLEIKIVDPACGAGAFLVGSVILIIQLLKSLESKDSSFDVQETLPLIVNNLYGFDIDNEAIKISKLRLFLYQISQMEKENSLTIPANFAHIDSLVYSKEKIAKYPFVNEVFDIVIGNPPFIRQELFNPSDTKQDFQEQTNRQYKEEIISSLERFLKNKVNLPIYLKGDFYIYFFYRGLSLLKDTGVLCFVSSNSWLDAKFGLVFQQFLLENYHLKFIYSNVKHKSFQASVNTAVSIISTKKEDDSFSRFIAFNDDLDKVLTKMNLLKIHTHKSHESFNDFRIHSLKQTELYNMGNQNEQFNGIRLGILLRAPEIYYKLITNDGEKIIRLGTLGKIRYPLKTGINDFFYLTDDIAKEFSIEYEYLIPVLKSPKRVNNLLPSAQDTSSKLFCCLESIESLKEKKKSGALSYIEWGTKQKTTSKQQTTHGTLWPDIPTVQFHKPGWYSVRMVDFADIFCNRFIDRRYFFCKNNSNTLEDQTFYGLILKDQEKANDQLIFALLNSTITYFFQELTGRSALGKGAVQFAIGDYNELPIINHHLIPIDLRKHLLNKFKKLASREILPIFEEVKRKDRLEFDLLLLEWLGLTVEEIGQFYNSFIQLVSQRIKKSGQKLK
ncbi:MAG: Eco57I restriction-modification methylase domain-containing protein [Candidatus Heimdallarchaeota archaeon]